MKTVVTGEKPTPYRTCPLKTNAGPSTKRRSTNPTTTQECTPRTLLEKKKNFAVPSLRSHISYTTLPGDWGAVGPLERATHAAGEVPLHSKTRRFSCQKTTHTHTHTHTHTRKAGHSRSTHTPLSLHAPAYPRPNSSSRGGGKV